MEIREVLSSPSFYAGLTSVIPYALCSLTSMGKLPKAVCTLTALGASAVLLDIAWQNRDPDDTYAFPEVISAFAWAVLVALVVLSAANDRRRRKV
jgi:hypothetical protein